MPLPDRALKWIAKIGLIKFWERTDSDLIAHEEKHIVLTEDGYFRELVKATDRIDVRDMAGLDVGCGGGRLANHLASRGALMHGVDISLPSGKHCLGGGNVRVSQATAEEIPFKSGAFDFVTCTDVIEHVVEYERVISELSRLVKKGGYAVVSIPKDYSTKNILMDLVFPAVKGAAFKIVGKDAPVPSRGHKHIFDTAGFQMLLESHGFLIDHRQDVTLPDISRNRFIVKPISWLAGLVAPSSKVDQIIFNLSKT